MHLYRFSSGKHTFNWLRRILGLVPWTVLIDTVFQSTEVYRCTSITKRINILNGTNMDIEIIEKNGVRFVNLQKLNKSDDNRLYKLPYNRTVFTNHGFFIKVLDYKFEKIASRAGYALVDLDDVKKYDEYEGRF